MTKFSPDKEQLGEHYSFGYVPNPAAVTNNKHKPEGRHNSINLLHFHRPRSTLTTFASRPLLSFTPISYLLHRIYTLSVLLYTDDFRYRFSPSCSAFAATSLLLLLPVGDFCRALIFVQFRFYFCDYRVGVSVVKPPPVVADFRSLSHHLSPISVSISSMLFTFDFDFSNLFKFQLP
ncbi:hypothetical protein LXL04_004337 [Taraxacum kok-saghyz]